MSAEEVAPVAMDSIDGSVPGAAAAATAELDAAAAAGGEGGALGASPDDQQTSFDGASNPVQKASGSRKGQGKGSGAKVTVILTSDGTGELNGVVQEKGTKHALESANSTLEFLGCGMTAYYNNAKKGKAVKGWIIPYNPEASAARQAKVLANKESKAATKARIGQKMAGNPAPVLLAAQAAMLAKKAAETGEGEAAVIDEALLAIINSPFAGPGLTGIPRPKTSATAIALANAASAGAAAEAAIAVAAAASIPEIVHKGNGDGQFFLTVKDALALAAALTDKAGLPQNVTVPSTNTVLPIVVSKNGCRRVDVKIKVEGDPTPDRRDGWMKLMEQNANKSSSTAARARNGAKIVHILPLQPDGSHTQGSGWGLVEDGVLTKNSVQAIDQASFEAYSGKRSGSGKKRAREEAYDAQPQKAVKLVISMGPPPSSKKSKKSKKKR